jgi:simple sugar transport system ATP-binding protein
MEACANGVAVIAYSSDLEEVVSIARRMLVVYAGEVRELPADLDLVGRAMLGAA